MENGYRVYVAWGGRADSLRDMGRQLASFVTALGTVSKRLAELRFFDAESGKEVAAAGSEACLQALEAHRAPWETGETQRVAYQPRLFLERRAAPPVEIELTCGIEPMNLGPIYTPNRLEVWVRWDAPDGLASVAVLEGIVRAAVEAWSPDWGFVGVDGYPEPPLAIFSEGTPVVGWMVYVSVKYPAIPAALPKPAVAHVLARRGTLIVCHPDLWNERDAAHVSAIEKVQEALEAAGVLVPAATLGESPSS